MGKRRKQVISTMAGLFYLITKTSQMRMDIWEVLIKIKKEKEPHGKESRIIGAW